MRVIVTGNAGKIGREAVKALTAAGHRAVGFDIKPGPDGARTLPVDCADFGQVIGALSGVDAFTRTPDAVVHLAGIPAPGLAPDHTTFEMNAVSTYNVFSACTRLGIPRIVWASSETIFGLPYTTPPPFLPVDETSPDRPEYHYALAKHVGETMAESFVRWREGLSIASMRFSNVFAEADRAALGEIQANPSVRKANLWGYVDAADAGQACRLAVEASLTGHERMVIAAADTIVDIPSAELQKTYFPDVELRAPLDGNASLLSSARARELIGYQPRISWRHW
jgi:nucleoside-diphosphate-sugar epimerase